MNKSKRVFIKSIILICCIGVVVGFGNYIYSRDKNKYEPKLWIGLFDYRLNLRDLGESLNKCLKKEIFETGLIYRSNKYFSGWSCDKINNPDRIYSLNFSPWNPHSYYCERADGSRLYGTHSNTTFEINNVEKIENWEIPELRETMCSFVKDALTDIVEGRNFLFHCDVGRDRTGAFAAILAMMMAEQQNMVNEKLVDAIECDYQKTSALESFKKGRMKNFVHETIREYGGMTKFINSKCKISGDLVDNAAKKFVKNNA